MDAIDKIKIENPIGELREAVACCKEGETVYDMIRRRIKKMAVATVEDACNLGLSYDGDEGLKGNDVVWATREGHEGRYLIYFKDHDRWGPWTVDGPSQIEVKRLLRITNPKSWNMLLGGKPGKGVKLEKDFTRSGSPGDNWKGLVAELPQDLLRGHMNVVETKAVEIREQHRKGADPFNEHERKVLGLSPLQEEAEPA